MEKTRERELLSETELLQ